MVLTICLSLYGIFADIADLATQFLNVLVTLLYHACPLVQSLICRWEQRCHNVWRCVWLARPLTL